MGISNFLQNDLFVDKKFSSKKEALTYFCKTLEKNGYVKSAKDALNLALEREKQFPTNIGSGIGMPHILNDVVTKPAILFAKVHGLQWDENDKSDAGKVNFVFHINYNKSTGESSHMETIQELSKLLMDDNFIKQLKSVNSIQELKAVINNINNPQSNLDERHWLSRGVITSSNDKSSDSNTSSNNSFQNGEQPMSKGSSSASNGYDVVAVTACPTGVAHTFLAKDSLEKKAKEMGVSIKVETQGTEGSRNTLTNEDIKNAKGVILALDRSIDTSKFSGKENVVETSTRSAIKDPEKEINKVLNNQGKTFKGFSTSNSEGKIEDTNLISFNNFGKRIYRSLMNGVGHMLPFVIFGGILIAIAFMIDSFSGVSGDNFGSITVPAKWFKQIGDIAFGLLVPILTAYMAFGLVGKGGLLPGFVCGFMAIGVMNIDILKIGTKEYNIPWLMEWLSDDKIMMLSNGSGFFGGIGGAILTAVIFILLTKYIFQKMPKSMNAINNILFMPLFGTLIIAGLFFLLNIPLQFVNLGFGMFLDLFAGRPELYPLLGLVMGLMMCADLGGPINKAAYVFGTIALAESASKGVASIPMAIAMGAGMVPPLAIAISGTIDRKAWTPEQRKESYVNYVLGISFISEGAIPFTAAQPKKMIICNLIGGAVAGIAVAALRVGSLAPHGGIFVAPLLRCEWGFANTEALKIGLGIAFFIGSVLLGSLAEAGMIAILSRTKFGRNKELEKVNA